MKITNFVILCLSVLTLTGMAGAGWIASDLNAIEQAPSVTVLDDNDAWQMNFHVPGVVHNNVNIDGRMIDRIELPGEKSLASEGEALLPQITRVLALRNADDPTLEILFENWEELDGSYELELRKDGEQADALSDAYMSRNSFQPETPYSISAVQNMGGVRFVTVRVNAVRYNPTSRKVEVLRDLDLRVHENGSVNPTRPITETNAMLLRPIVENWDEMGLDEFVVRGSILYIYNSTIAGDPTHTVSIDKLKYWHERKGHKVEIATQGSEITTWTNAGIKNYIQNRYNNTNPPLEHVLLIGDANGTSLIPYWTASFEGSSGVSDFEYTRLEGNDLISDISLGRMCFNSNSELALQVNRNLRYERTPSPADTVSGGNPDWYEGAGLFTTSSTSGLSTVHTMQSVRDRLLEAGYNSASIDTMYHIHDFPGADDVATSFNSGISVFCHRGYVGTLPYDITDLTNAEGTWPFMMNLTCGTSDYNYTDECEDFLNAGTAAQPLGVIGVIGMSTLHTNTRYNNCLMAGGMQGLLLEGITKTGAIMNRSRIELLDSYLPDSEERTEFFCGITNLLGDPTIDVFTGTPDNLSVNAPSTASIGLNSMTVMVTNQLAQPVADAYVHLFKNNDVFTGGRTDASGQITLYFAATSVDTLHVTATKHNCRPALDYTLIQSSTGYVSPASETYIIDDDGAGTSSGNTDGFANPGETIELAIPLKNWGTSSVSSVVATLSSSDPYVASITDNSESHGTIAGGAIDNPPDDFDFTIAGYVPDGQVLQFTLSVSSSAGTHVSGVAIPVANGNYEYVSHTLSGVGDTQLDPGESGEIYLTLENVGGALIAAASATLTSLNPAVTVTDPNGNFSAAASGATSDNSGNRFGLSATMQAYPGEHVTLQCVFPLANGFADTVLFDVVIGSGSSSTPTPPDDYGYWAFDNTDTAYPKAPTFNWIELDPAEGGDGTVVNIIDDANEADDATSVSLPFTFRFYGQDYNDIAICSNGWLAMGADQQIHTDFRNYYLPSALGPSAMIAPFWDDLVIVPASAPANSVDEGIDYEQMASEENLRSIHGEIDNLLSRRKNADEYESGLIKQRLMELYAELGIERHEYSENTGTRHLNSTLDQGSETCDGATVINSVPYHVTGTLGLTTDCQSTSLSPVDDVFYVFNVPETASYTIDMCGSEGDTYLKFWMDGTCCVGITDYNDDSCGDHDPLKTMILTGGTTIYIECGHWQGAPDPGSAYNFNITSSPIVSGRCCYGSPYDPDCSYEPQATCLARVDDISWDESLDCNTACPIADDPCETATVIPSIPATINGTTVGATDQYSPICGQINTCPDVFYRYTATTTEVVSVSMCLGNTDYDAKLAILENGIEVYCEDDVCSNPPIYTSNYLPRITDVTLTSGYEYCFVVTGWSSSSAGPFTLFIGPAVGRCCYGDPEELDCADELLESECDALSGDWTEGLTCEAFPCPIPPQPDGVFTKHDAANHRFIVQWSGSKVVNPYYPLDGPEEVFQAILYEPGYPATPTGDGEILFQYYNVTNTTEDSRSNHYCTVGIENHDNSDGLTYSYWGQQDPDIPGSASIINGRAVLFTTQKSLTANPAAVEDLTVIRTGNDVILRWSPVTEDEFGGPLTVDGYHVYGGTSSDVNIGTADYLGSTPSTSFTDGAGLTRDIYFYIVVAYVN
ncbi:hypothetical protein KKG66_06950 [bacterium]|nr:hypothetical protein [bacterium]